MDVEPINVYKIYSFIFDFSLSYFICFIFFMDYLIIEADLFLKFYSNRLGGRLQIGAGQRGRCQSSHEQGQFCPAHSRVVELSEAFKVWARWSKEFLVFTYKLIYVKKKKKNKKKKLKWKCTYRHSLRQKKLEIPLRIQKYLCYQNKDFGQFRFIISRWIIPEIRKIVKRQINELKFGIQVWINKFHISAT